MIARTVRRQRPQSAPAPHAWATSLVVDAPAAMTSDTVALVIPLHRHTTTPAIRSARLDAHHVREAADEDGRIRADAGAGHPLGGSVGMVDPLPRTVLVGEFRQDQHLMLIVESLEYPSLSDTRRGETVPSGADLGVQGHHITDRRERGEDDPRGLRCDRRRRDEPVHDLPGEDRRNVFDARFVEPVEKYPRAQQFDYRFAAVHTDEHQHAAMFVSGGIEHNGVWADVG